MTAEGCSSQAQLQNNASPLPAWPAVGTTVREFDSHSIWRFRIPGGSTPQGRTSCGNRAPVPQAVPKSFPRLLARVSCCPAVRLGWGQGSKEPNGHASSDTIVSIRFHRLGRMEGSAREWQYNAFLGRRGRFKALSRRNAPSLAWQICSRTETHSTVLYFTVRSARFLRRFCDVSAVFLREALVCKADAYGRYFTVQSRRFS
jgi:hypothetical protein